MKKYLRLTSVTWWASATPLASGVFLAFEPVHQMSEYTASVSAMFGDVSPAVLINMGLAGIGLRGAIN